MKKNSISQSAFSNLRVLVASLLCLTGVFVALGATSINSTPSKAQTATQTQHGPAAPAAANQPGGPAVAPLVGPVILNRDLRDLPYIAPNPEVEEKRLTRYPHPEIPLPAGPNPSEFERFKSLLKQIIPPTPMMPGPILTFDGMNSAQAGVCVCRPILMVMSARIITCNRSIARSRFSIK